MNQVVLTLFVMLLFLVGVTTGEASDRGQDTGHPIAF